MSHNALLEYIRKARDCGASDAEIEKRLHAAGWYAVDVQDGLELYHKLTAMAEHKTCASQEPAAPKPSLTERIVPRSYDPHLIAVAAVSFALGFLLYVWLSRLMV
jgi:hypothetical protein